MARNLSAPLACAAAQRVQVRADHELVGPLRQHPEARADPTQRVPEPAPVTDAAKARGVRFVDGFRIFRDQGVDGPNLDVGVGGLIGPLTSELRRRRGRDERRKRDLVFMRQA